jgi:hypothetical protein
MCVCIGHNFRDENNGIQQPSTAIKPPSKIKDSPWKKCGLMGFDGSLSQQRRRLFIPIHQWKHHVSPVFQ